MAINFFVVCGRASSRASWNNSGTMAGTSYVACDFHTQVAIVTSVIDSGGVPANALFYGPQNERNLRRTIHERGE